MLHLRSILMYIQRMLDIKFIREHAGEVRIAITNKGINLNLDELLAADMERSAAMRAIEDLNEAKNKLNDEMKAAKNDAERKEIILKGKEVKGKLADLEPKVQERRHEIHGAHGKSADGSVARHAARKK